MCADTTIAVSRQENNPSVEPSSYERWVSFPEDTRDLLLFIRQQCELLPDRPEPGNTRIWTETINLIHAAVVDALEADARQEGGA